MDVLPRVHLSLECPHFNYRFLVKSEPDEWFRLWGLFDLTRFNIIVIPFWEIYSKKIWSVRLIQEANVACRVQAYKPYSKVFDFVYLVQEQHLMFGFILEIYFNYLLY